MLCIVDGLITMYYVAAFFNKPKVKVKGENTYSEEDHVVEGVLQGRAFSCTCFDLGIDGCLSILPHNVKSTFYVDD